MTENEKCKKCLYYGGYGGGYFWCFAWERFIVKRVMYCSFRHPQRVKEGEDNADKR